MSRIIFLILFVLTTEYVTQSNCSDDEILKFKFGVISDLDTHAVLLKMQQGQVQKTKSVVAYLREGILWLSKTCNTEAPFNVSLEMDVSTVKEIHNHEIVSQMAYGGRGMELSLLIKFNNKIYSCDDKTGVVYELPISESIKIVPIPWVILSTGNSEGPDGFKCEWSTIKDGKMIIGSHGTIRKTRYIKVITPEGVVTHVNWSDNYNKIETVFHVHYPGYVSTEALGWSSILGKWFVLPRKVNSHAFTEDGNAILGNNLYLIADEDFSNIEVKKIGELIPGRGFSSFKFIPTTNDFVILALKTVEFEHLIETYIMAFDLNGNLLFPENKFAAQKYEGLEFLD